MINFKKYKLLNFNKKQKGFSILAIILVIVAVILAIGIWSLSGQTNTNNSSNNDLLASAIVQDGISIKIAYDTLVSGGANPNSIILRPNVSSNDMNPNMLDPTNGIIYPQVNINSIDSRFPSFWAFYKNVQASTFVGKKKMVLLPAVNDSICKRINTIYNGIDNIPTVTVNLTGEGFMTTAFSPNNPTNELGYLFNDLPSDMNSGCVSATSTTYQGTIATMNYYFRIL